MVLQLSIIFESIQFNYDLSEQKSKKCQKDADENDKRLPSEFQTHLKPIVRAHLASEIKKTKL